MEKHQRPLSPFMLGSGYKFQQTSVMSFLHRLTGIASLVVVLVICAWIIAIPFNLKLAVGIQSLLTHYAFFPLLAIGVASTVYHFCNGIRHLFWDAGIGISNEEAQKSGRWVIIASVIVTIAILGVGICA